MKTEIKQKPVNTRRFQMYQLSHYMLTEHEAIFDGVGFTSEESQFTFAQAVEAYNKDKLKGEDGYIVDRVKLRYSKKQKKIICTDNLVTISEAFKDHCHENDIEPFEGLKEILRMYRLR